MKKLLLIDGNAIMHRAYHALPPLTTPDGRVINAVYGFFSMVLTVISDLKPEYVIVSFDISKPTYRQSLYAGYHEHRPVMADDLGSQFAIVHEVLRKMNIQIYEVAGYEADDVIGTIAHQVTNGRLARHFREPFGKLRAQRGNPEEKRTGSLIKSGMTKGGDNAIEVVILTGDRDLLQLVNSHVKVLMPIVGVKTTILHDEKSVEEKYGVKPSQFVDYKALIGDQSDGYPGVTGIGPKTAAKLLQKYKTFEDIYDNLGQISETYATKLATDAEQAALAKKLAQILTDVPVTCKIEECTWLDVNTNGVWEVFEELGFESLMKRFAGMFKEIESRKKGEQLGLL